MKRFFASKTTWMIRLEILITLPFVTGTISAQDLPSAAMAKAAELAAAKLALSPTELKLESNLYSAMQKMQAAGMTRENAAQRYAKAVFATPLLEMDAGGRLHLILRMTEITQALLSQLAALEFEVQATTANLPVTPNHQMISGWAPFDRIGEIAKLPPIFHIRPVDRPIAMGAASGEVTSAGDAILRANLARSTFGVDGTGQKVGILSFGVDHLENSQASADLPATVEIISDRIRGDEGTAMLEIVHDLAPGARLAYADAGMSQVDFANNITLLRNAGCTVICDDVIYFSEPVYEDGVIAQIVDNFVSARNIVYASAAGNQQLDHHEGDFLDTDGDGFYNFTSTDETMDIELAPNSTIQAVLQWNSPFGRAADDYDLFIYQNLSIPPVAASTNRQNGDDDPYELATYTNTSAATIMIRLVVQKIRGVNRRLSIITYGSGITPSGEGVRPLEFVNVDGAVYGHAAAQSCLAVGAISADDPGNDIEPFSSRGPSRIYSYDINGNPFSFVDRPKPDHVAIDGVETKVGRLGFFFNPFGGTSAATAHTAGIAALFRQKNPSLPAGEVSQALNLTAVDLGVAGFDQIFGNGRIDALNVLRIPTTATNAAANLTPTSALLKATVNPNGLSTIVKFQYGITTSYGSEIAATPSPLSGLIAVEVSAVLTGLSPNTLYHYRVVGTNSAGISNGADIIFGTLTSNQPPELASNITPQTLVVDQTSFTRDLYAAPVVFNDPDGDSLIYSSNSSNSAVAIARITGSILTVSAVASGEASITVSAQDRRGGSATTTFMVSVDTPPIVANRLADINLTFGSRRTLVRDLDASPFVFSDRDGDKLSYIAASSDSSIAVASVSGNILYVSPNAVGAADMTVEANDGKGGRAKTIFRVTVKEPQAAPAISPNLFSSAQPLYQDIVISARITDNTVVASAYLYFRKGGELNFKEIGLRPLGSANYSATIPRDEVTGLGLEYYFEATDNEGLTARKPLSGVYAIRVEISAPGFLNIVQPSGSKQIHYRLISAPLDLKNKTPQAVLADDLGEYKKNQWRFHELLANQSYVEYPNTSNITPGKAFWLIVRQPQKIIGTGAGVTIRSDTVFSIPLHPGWNFIGNPFPFSVPLRNMHLKNSEKPMTLRTYRGSWNDPINGGVEVMLSTEGLAISNDLGAPDTLLINPNLSDTTNILFKRPCVSLEKNLKWSVHILAQCQEARDIDNHAAVISRATANWDEFDLPEPIAVIDDYLSVYFSHDDWNAPSKKYCLDARPEPADGEIWEFVVTTNIRDKVNLTFAGLASVPKEFEVWLVDERLGITQNLREENGYSVAGFEHPKPLKLLVGKPDFVEQNLANVQSIPVAYELQQNFPNPFNPATTIRYGLPQAECVTLTIYNLLGEEVVKLVDNAEKKAGYHVAIWDGRNRDGQSATSGVYIFRLRAGNFVSVKKMALVK